ncbi:MAG: SUMF1/EgtB/PvdO family nonheme iron enzyme [Egibacteraceae bacterium]
MADRRKAALARALDEGRRWTHRLLDPLDDDAVHRQHNPIMSPLVWDLGHIGNFEELWLLRALGDRCHHDPDLDRIYNPFDNPRWTRADLPLLPRPEAHTYLADVRADALRLMRRTALDPDAPLLAHGYVYDLVIQHEAQHQETMLQALDLREDAAPYPLAALAKAGALAPQGVGGSPPRQGVGGSPPRQGVGGSPPRKRVDDAERVVIPAGPFWMGAPASGCEYDNERPRRRVGVDAFAIDRFPVTTRRYAEFVAAWGYSDDRWWSARGLEWRAETGHRWPQGWVPDGHGGWLVRRFGDTRPLDPREPVEHVSFFEAEAFAAWAGGRLPTEAEWEKAAAHDPATGRSRRWPWGQTPPSPVRANLDRGRFGPAPVGSFPSGASAYGVEQLLGDCYEWTISAFEPYPGYVTFPYPEYSEVFFGGDWRVLRGASWATRSCVARTTFRNWDRPYRRQLFAGLRVAYDVR